MVLISDKKVNKKFIIALIITYLIILLWVIVFKCNHNEYLHVEQNRSLDISQRIEPYPFYKVVFMYNRGFFSAIEIVAFIFNLICMLPFGALLRFFTDKKWLIYIFGATFSIGVEAFQVFSGWGGLEYTDICMMILGVIFGVYIYDFLRARMSDKLINLISAVIVCFGMPLAILTIIRTINNFPVQI